MNHKSTLIAVTLFVVAAMTQAAWSQNGISWDRDATGRVKIYERGGVPLWENNPQFKNDVFTFARIEYSSAYTRSRNFDYFRSAALPFGNQAFAQRRGGRGGGGGGGRGGRGGWTTDFPEADLNFSYRLQQLTSLKVNPWPVVVRFTDENLFDYPFIYMVEVFGGALEFTSDDVVALRRYLLNGGFLMVDDFWGQEAWDWFADEMRRVFPDREFVDLKLDHEIFNCVYKLKELPQVRAWGRGSRNDVTYEYHGAGSETVHFRALSDDKGRIMVLACHNTDIGDGWEREGYDEWYFHNYCENKSYPMGINVITYALTH